MKKVLVFGATGNLGKEIARKVVEHGYSLGMVVRNKQKAAALSHLPATTFVADVTNPASLKGICAGYEVVISPLGKSVSPNDQSKAGFYDIDFLANTYILEEAIKSCVQKFVYVSAFHAEKYLHLAYCKSHHDFSERLKKSGINYSIIKPPALFSAFIDMIEMARKGMLFTIGTGDKKTNPIYEGDLAAICVESITQKDRIIEAGGKQNFTRKELVDIIQQNVNPKKKVPSLPLGLFTFSLPLLKIFNRNMYDKLSFFVEVTQHDTLAPPMGESSFEEYINTKIVSLKPG